MSHYYIHFRQSGDGGTLYLKTADFVVSAGDLTLTAGDLTVTAGSQTITAGDLTLTAGDVNVTAGAIGLSTVSIIHATTTPSMSGHAPGSLCLVDDGSAYIKTGTVGSTTWRAVATV